MDAAPLPVVAVGATAEPARVGGVRRPPDRSLVTTQLTTLPSGLVVATEHVPSALSVACGAWVGVGARDEPAGLAGVSHFLEHLLFKGTVTRSAQEINRTVDRVGGDMNAFTAKEYTAFYCRLPAARLELGLELLGEVVSRPALRDADVETERQVILEELAMDDDEPDDVAYRLLAEALYPDHPLGRETAGERATVETIAPTDVRRFHGAHYGTTTTVVSVAGPVDHDRVVALVAEAFAALTPTSRRPERSAPGPCHGGEISREDDTEQVQLLMGMRAFERTDPDREALDVLVHVLGGGMSSRLFDAIREQRGLAYSVYAGSSLFDDAGALSVYAGTQPQHLDEVLGLVEHELDQMAATGITAEELDIAVGYLTGAFVLGLEDTGSRMARAAGQLITTGSVRTVDEQLARWSAVTLTDVRRVAERVLGAPRVRVTVGPV